MAGTAIPVKKIPTTEKVNQLTPKKKLPVKKPTTESQWSKIQTPIVAVDHILPTRQGIPYKKSIPIRFTPKEKVKKLKEDEEPILDEDGDQKLNDQNLKETLQMFNVQSKKRIYQPTMIRASIKNGDDDVIEDEENLDDTAVADWNDWMKYKDEKYEKEDDEDDEEEEEVEKKTEPQEDEIDPEEQEEDEEDDDDEEEDEEEKENEEMDETDDDDVKTKTTSNVARFEVTMYSKDLEK